MFTVYDPARPDPDHQNPPTEDVNTALDYVLFTVSQLGDHAQVAQDGAVVANIFIYGPSVYVQALPNIPEEAQELVAELRAVLSAEFASPTFH